MFGRFGIGWVLFYLNYLSGEYIMWIGYGFDVYVFGGEGLIIIGGVCIFYEKGLLVYFDGDVVFYVLIDVLFGVVVLGDIGKLFLDIDLVFKGVDSCELLCEVWCRI